MRAVGLTVDAVYLDRVLAAVAPVYRRNYRRRPDRDAARLHHPSVHRHISLPENSLRRVHFDAAEHLAQVGTAVQLAGAARNAGVHADYLRVRDAALPDRDRQPRVGIADTVPERAEHAAVRVAEGERSKSGQPVAQPYAEQPLSLARLRGRHIYAHALAPALKPQAHALTSAFADRGDDLLRVGDLTAVDRGYQIALMHARALRRGHRPALRLDLRKARYHYALCAYLYSNDLPADNKLLCKGRNRKHRRKQQRPQAGHYRPFHKNFPPG